MFAQADGSRIYAPFSLLEAAAARASAFFSSAVCFFFGSQLPFSPGSIPGTGVNPGQQRLVCSAGFVLFFALFLWAVLLPAVFFAVFFAVLFLVVLFLVVLFLVALFLVALFFAVAIRT